jgi:hypothetical protein
MIAGGTISGNLVVTGSITAATVAVGSNQVVLPTDLPSLIEGLTTSRNTGTQITVASGRAITTDATGTSRRVTTLSSAITKSLSSNWVVGNSNGGLDTGALAAAATYHIFLIDNTSNVDVLLSTSLTPTMPSGYTFRRRIGSITTSASTIVEYTQQAKYFEYKNVINAFNNYNVSATGELIVMPIPIGIRLKVRAFYSPGYSLSGYETSQVCLSPDVTPYSLGNDMPARPAFVGTVGGYYGSYTDTSGIEIERVTDTSGRLYFRRSSFGYLAGGLNQSTFRVLGYEDIGL